MLEIIVLNLLHNPSLQFQILLVVTLTATITAARRAWRRYRSPSLRMTSTKLDGSQV